MVLPVPLVPEKSALKPSPLEWRFANPHVSLTMPLWRT